MNNLITEAGQLLESPEGQMLKATIVSIVEEKVQEELSKKGLSGLFNKIKGMFNMADENTNTTNTSVSDAAKTAAESALNTAAQEALDTGDSSSFVSELITKAHQRIAELEAEENGDSKSWYVKKFRDPAEVIGLNILIVGAAAGSAAAVANLAKKFN